MLRTVIPAGVALSAEKDFNQLLETLVVEAQKLCNADGGLLYLLTDETQLQAVIVRNPSLGIAMGGKRERPGRGALTSETVPLYLEDKEPNRHHVTAHVALTQTRANIEDAYASQEYDFAWLKAFDARTGRRSKSLLAIPLTGDEGQVIGVLQLMNARDEENRELIPFIVDDVIETLVLLASAALSSYLREEKLRREIAQLQIRIDLELKEKEVADVTGTDYFQQLQAQTEKLRSRTLTEY
jgi:hypothetical protein